MGQQARHVTTHAPGQFAVRGMGAFLPLFAELCWFYFRNSLSVGCKNLPSFGCENLLSFGCENLPSFGCENLPSFGYETSLVSGVKLA